MSRVDYPGGITRRHEFLHEIGRHCDANSGRCHHKAVVEWDGFSLAEGKRVEQVTGRKVCSKHKKLYFDSSGWEVTSQRSLTDNYDDAGNLKPGKVNPWDARNERAAKRNADEAPVTTTTPVRTAPATEMRFSG